MSMKNKFVAVITIVVTLLQLCQVTIFAQITTVNTAYRVGVGDKLFMSVPQRSDLNRELTIKENGNVELPLIGDVGVIGLTTQEIENRLYQALKEYYPSVTEVEITLLEATSQVIHVIGQVNVTGKYNFLEGTNPWEAIRDAGGPTDLASLDDVRVVKSRERGGSSRVVNIQAALEFGTVEQLPDLEPGDTVIVPEEEEKYTGTLGVNVFGAVVNPGPYKLQGYRDLVSAILLAGGPTNIASLSDVKIIRTLRDGGLETIEVDLRKYLNKGDPLSNPDLQIGDTVHIPTQNFVVRGVKNLGFWVNVVTAAVSVTAIILVIDERRNR